MTNLSKNILLYMLLFILHIISLIYGFYYFEKNLCSLCIIILSISSLVLLIACVYIYHLFSEKLTKQMNLYNECEKHNEIKDMMLQISNSLIRIHNKDELLQIFAESAIKLMDKCDTTSILIKNQDGKFEYKVSCGFNLDELSTVQLSSDELFIHEDNHPRATIIPNPKFFDQTNMKKDHFNILANTHSLDIQSTISTPIIIDQKLYGIMNVDSLNSQVIFDSEDLMIMEYLVGQLEIAIQNLLLFEKTRFLSRYDGLTKLYHRHYFDEMFKKTYTRAKRYNEDFCFCIMDLNNLKQINDVYGHLAGDKAISYFAQVLRNHVRCSDLLGRFGGDEFVMIFLNGDYKQAECKMNEILQIIQNEPLHYECETLYIQFSFGISSFPKDTEDEKKLVKIADDRMYANKKYQKTM